MAVPIFSANYKGLQQKSLEDLCIAIMNLKDANTGKLVNLAPVDVLQEWILKEFPMPPDDAPTAVKAGFIAMFGERK